LPPDDGLQFALEEGDRRISFFPLLSRRKRIVIRPEFSFRAALVTANPCGGAEERFFVARHHIDDLEVRVAAL
jgi:hypothetical protein